MADGRWLRISRSPTRDSGFIVLCSDISRLKKQEWSLRETNVLLDVALENMSQGCASTTRRIGSKSSTGASWKSSGCRPIRSAPA